MSYPEPDIDIDLSEADVIADEIAAMEALTEVDEPVLLDLVREGREEAIAEWQERAAAGEVMRIA